MAKFSYFMSQREAILSIKKAIVGQIGILKDKSDKLVLGAPFMKVYVSFNDGVCKTKSNLFGKSLIGTINSKIELIDGFKKC